MPAAARLEAGQFLIFDRVTRKYSPGPEIFRLSGVMLHRDAPGKSHVLTLDEPPLRGMLADPDVVPPVHGDGGLLAELKLSRGGDRKRRVNCRRVSPQ